MHKPKTTNKLKQRENNNHPFLNHFLTKTQNARITCNLHNGSLIFIA